MPASARTNFSSRRKVEPHVSRRELCLVAVNTCASSLGHVPTWAQYDVWSHNQSSYAPIWQTLKKHTSALCWNDLLELAGLTLPPPRVWTKDEVDEAVKAFLCEYPNRPIYQQYRAWQKASPDERPSLRQMKDFYTHWGEALATHGRITCNLRWDKALIIEAIETCAHDLAKLPSYVEYETWAYGNRCRPSGHVIKYAFGSWQKALQMTCLDTSARKTLKRWSKTELIDILAAFVCECSRPTSAVYIEWARVQPVPVPHMATFAYHFGSWNSALRAVGTTPVRYRTHWDRESAWAVLIKAHDDIADSFNIASYERCCIWYVLGLTEGDASWAQVIDPCACTRYRQQKAET